MGYLGSAGITRSEQAFVRESDGSLRPVALHTVVNVETHPEIAALALAGDLHRLDDGRELAVPFVYHDPALEAFVLVVPTVLAHLEIELRAKLMDEVASDAAHPAPPYVLACESVLGIAALRAIVDGGAEPSDEELQEVESAVEPAKGEKTGEWFEVGASPASPLPRNGDKAGEWLEVRPGETTPVSPLEAAVAEPAPMDVEDSEIENISASRHEPPQSGPGETTCRVEAGEVWIHVRLEERHAGAFAGAMGLLPQYAEVEGYPTALVTLVDESGVDDASARVALDLRAEVDRAVLERLARAFRVKVVRTIGDRHLGTRTLAAPREEVAQAILARAGRANATPAIGSAEALARVVASPPPIGNESSPFGPAVPLPTLSSVRTAVAGLAEWTHAERREEAVLTYGVPPHVIDATIRRVLLAAALHGIALLDRLEGMAVAQRIAPSREALVRAQVDGFRRAVERGENDLSPAETQANWRRLLAQAARLGVALSADERRLPAVSERDDATGSAAEAMRRLDDSGTRVAALEELCLRGHTPAIAAITPAIALLAPEACARAFAFLLLFGEAAREALVGCLASEHARVRQGAALALGRLPPEPNSIEALIATLDAEPAPLWREIARALGDLGDSVALAIIDGRGWIRDPERLRTLFAHLATRGLGPEVESLESAEDPGIAAAARDAGEMRSAIEGEDRLVRFGGDLPEDAEAARFSQCFHLAVREVGV